MDLHGVMVLLGFKRNTGVEDRLIPRHGWGTFATHNPYSKNREVQQNPFAPFSF